MLGSKMEDSLLLSAKATTYDCRNLTDDGGTSYCWTNPDQPFSFLPQPPDSLPAVSLDLLRPGTKVAVAE